MNFWPGERLVMSKTFQPRVQFDGSMPVERTQNWTRRLDWRVGATQEWYRSDRREMKDRASSTLYQVSTIKVDRRINSYQATECFMQMPDNIHKLMFSLCCIRTSTRYKG